MRLPRLGRLVLVLMVASVGGTAAAAPPAGAVTQVEAPPTVAGQPWFGVLELDGRRAPAVAAAGVDVAVLAVAWDRFEPRDGVVDEGYVAETRARYAALRRAGLEVVLDLGPQYPPAWVWTIPDAAMVDQHGRQWRGGVGGDVPDVVHNGQVRKELGDFVAAAGSRFGDLALEAVRIGGGPFNELRYPEPPAPRHDSWWAYSAGAQQDSPVPGWRPGDAGSDRAAAFLDWYTQSLTEYLLWQVDAYRQAFGPDVPLHVLEPSWGVRPGEREAAALAGLDGTTRGEARQTLQQGLDWGSQVRALGGAATGASAAGPVGEIVLWSTWLDAPDQGDDEGFEAPVEHLARLSTALCRPLPVGGENTGRGSSEDMRLSVDKVRALGLIGMLWMREPDMYDGTHARLEEYGRLIAPPSVDGRSPRSQ